MDTISQQLEQISGLVCGNICKYAEAFENSERTGEDEAELDKRCKDCPLMRL